MKKDLKIIPAEIRRLYDSLGLSIVEFQKVYRAGEVPLTVICRVLGQEPPTFYESKNFYRRSGNAKGKETI